MSIYNKPELKINIGCNTPSVCHKKINSVNFSSSNTNRYTQGNTKKYISKNQLNFKSSSNLNSDSHLLNYNSHIVPGANINKVLTTANIKNRRIEIDLNKNNSPRAKFNKSMGENMIIFKNKQNTSHNNINNINNVNNINHNKFVNRNDDNTFINEKMKIRPDPNKSIFRTNPNTAFFNQAKNKKDDIIVMSKGEPIKYNYNEIIENKLKNDNNNININEINENKINNYKKQNEILTKYRNNKELKKKENITNQSNK